MSERSSYGSGGAAGSSYGGQAIAATQIQPARDTVTKRLGEIYEHLGNCHALLHRIQEAVGLPPQDAANDAIGGPGIAGSVMGLGTAVLNLRAELERTLNAL